MKIAASMVLRANGRRMNFTLPVLTYLSTNGPSTVLENSAQCGQVGEAYSMNVTFAAGSPETLSGIPAGAISLSRSIVSPSLAKAREGRPAAPRTVAAAASVKVSRRLKFTGFLLISRGNLHSLDGGARAQTLSFGHVLARSLRVECFAQALQRFLERVVANLGHCRIGAGHHLRQRHRIGGFLD